MDEEIPLPFDLPAVARKKVSAAFDGGRVTSDGGVMLLAQAERRLGIADQLARVIPDESVDYHHCCLATRTRLIGLSQGGYSPDRIPGKRSPLHGWVPRRGRLAHIDARIPSRPYHRVDPRGKRNAQAAFSEWKLGSPPPIPNAPTLTEVSPTVFRWREGLWPPDH